MTLSRISARRAVVFGALCASFALFVFLGFSLRAHADTFPTPCDIFDQLGEQGLPPGSCTPTPPTCDAGQHLDSDTNTCVPDAPTCGDGQHLDSDTNQCVEDVPTCDAGQHLDADTNTCVPDAPTCTDGQHLDTDTNTCVDDTTADTDTGGGNDTEGGSADTNTTSGGNGGGGGGGGGGNVISGPLSPGFVNTASSSGEVLGTSTEATSETTPQPASCTPVITSYLKMGGSNDPAQVKVLQNFLNEHIDAGLPVTGYFGPLTFAAVKKFQTQYWQDVLAPWVPHGLGSDHAATGYVYKTTQRMINMLSCSSLSIPVPDLP